LISKAFGRLNEPAPSAQFNWISQLNRRVRKRKVEPWRAKASDWKFQSHFALWRFVAIGLNWPSQNH